MIRKIRIHASFFVGTYILTIYKKVLRESIYNSTSANLHEIMATKWTHFWKIHWLELRKQFIVRKWVTINYVSRECKTEQYRFMWNTGIKMESILENSMVEILQTLVHFIIWTYTKYVCRKNDINWCSIQGSLEIWRNIDTLRHAAGVNG